MNLSSKTPGDERHAVAPLSRLGERWSTAEYAQLVQEIRSGLTVSEIATAHGRPHEGIAAACNRLLPTDRRPSSRQHAPAALHRYLHEHPDGTLTIPTATTTRRRKRSTVEFTPLPERTAEGLAADAQFEPGDAAALIAEAIAGTEGKPREQRILRMRVGFEDAPHTLAEIAEQLSVSRERVRQIQTRALTLLVRQGRKAGTPGSALAARLHLPSPDALDEAFADHIATIVSAEFEAPSRVAIPILLCAAGVASSTARQVAILAGVAEERRQKLETQQRRAATAAHRATTVVRRADAVVARWTKHASWPAAVAPPPEREKLRALRLDGAGEAAGIFRSPKLGRTVFYESGLELAALTILENSEDIAWYQEQPLKIPYTWEGRHRVYYPDILVATRTGRCLLIEVKPLTNMPVALNRAKAAAGRAYAHHHGWGSVTIDGPRTEHDLKDHVIPSTAQLAITAELKTNGHLGWRHVLELRTNAGVSARDIAAFIIQTGARLTLEPRYRITPPR